MSYRNAGIFTTVADVTALWAVLDGGAVVSAATWAEMRRGRSTDDGLTWSVLSTTTE